MDQRKHRKRELTVDREMIEWYPSVTAEKCRGCQICVDFCFKKVYHFDEITQKALVVNPYQCVVLCSGCLPKCPHGAITFPKREDFEHFVRYATEENK